MKKIVSALLIMLMLIQTVSFAAVNKIYSEEDTKLLVDRLSTFGIFEQFDDELFFGDNANVKRSEAAVVISNMLGMKTAGSESTAVAKFYDVPQYSSYINAVNYVTGLGIMSANEMGLFKPDDTMEIVHVYKALVTALGYGWKAEAYGGYPAGYVKVAAELELTDAITKGINDIASRVDFLNIVNAALDAPICRMKSISGDVMDFEIDEDVTVLSEYHSIYFDEGVVENDKTMAISSSIKLEDNVVYIGGRKLFVDNALEVYGQFGKNMVYYYRHDKKAETDHLVAIVPTEDNTEIKIAKADFESYADGKVSYYNAEGKKKEIKLSGSAVVLYNSEIATNVADAITSFEGTMTLIDNNNDKHAEVVIAKNYTYDIVKTVKAAENKLYGKNSVFDLESYEAVSIIHAETGEVMGLAGIEAGMVIGYAVSTDETKLMIDVIGSGLAVKIASVSGDEFTTDDGAVYNTELLSAEHKNLIKPNTAISVAAIDGYYAVWATAASEAVASLGYLINIATESEFSQTYILGARILDTGGTIKAFKPANKKKLILNGKSLEATALINELARIKDEYQLGGDGHVAQLIGYKMDDEGNLTHLYTVDDDQNSEIFLKYGYGRDGLANMYSNFGYSIGKFTSSGATYEGKVAAVHDYYTNKYLILNTHPLFKVPSLNQETAGEEWYSVGKMKNSDYEGVSGMAIETFTNGELGIVPRAAVEYRSSAVSKLDVVKAGDLVLIDETYQNLNSDDGVDYVVKGLLDKAAVTYTVNPEEVDVATIDSQKAIEGSTEEEAGFTRGDIAMVQLDALNNIIQIAKIYDHETGNMHPRLNPADATSSSMQCALILHPYNKPADGYGIEFFEEDLTQGVPSKDRMLLLDLGVLGAGKVNDKAVVFKFYDESEDKVYLGSSLDVIDYQQDKENYTRIFAIHKNSSIAIVFYNK